MWVVLCSSTAFGGEDDFVYLFGGGGGGGMYDFIIPPPNTIWVFDQAMIIASLLKGTLLKGT